MPSRSLPQTVTDDLLHTLLDEADPAYPWDLTANGAVEAFTESLADFSLFETWEEEEIDESAGIFFTHLQQHWQAIESPNPRVSFFEKFAALLPADSLTRIIEQAETVIHQPIDVLDRLVACIRPLFPRWSEEDLLVFARPYALAMRDTTASTIDESKEWQNLSEIEKIRLGAAIASQILQELSSNP
jgi:hypothetical protein